MELQDIQRGMQDCKETGDEEIAHSRADKLLCELATLLASRLDSETQQKVEEIVQIYG